MKPLMRFVVAALCLWPAFAFAEVFYLSGNIGAAPVLVMLDGKSGKVSGWYLYLRHGRQIRLDGTVNAAGNFAINETPPDATEATGILRGAVRGTSWSGTWSPFAGIGRQVPVALTENRDRLAALSGHFACTGSERDPQADWVFSETLDLTLVHGRATKFSASHMARGEGGDEQACSIALNDVDRVPAQGGIAFRAKGDDPHGEAGHCSIRVVAAGDYLYLAMEDFTEDGNDCRGSGDTMYCSPRGNWNDLILNRKTGECTMVQ